MRQLPDFMVIGAQRSGTSSLFLYLSTHPNVRRGLRKETEYFSRFYERGPRWYAAHFPLRRPHSAPPALTYEATPDYLYNPHSPERIAKDLPEARFIVVLRDPAVRAYSHWQHMRRLGYEDLSFTDALAAEPERLVTSGDPFQGDGAEARRVLRHSYIARGRYDVQLQNWFAFFPRERFHIAFAEDLFTSAQEALSKILMFLDLPQASVRTDRNYSYRDGRRTAAPQMDPSTNERLQAIYDPHNRALAELLGVAPPWVS